MTEFRSVLAQDVIDAVHGLKNALGSAPFPAIHDWLDLIENNIDHAMSDAYADGRQDEADEWKSPEAAVVAPASLKTRLDAMGLDSSHVNGVMRMSDEKIADGIESAAPAETGEVARLAEELKRSLTFADAHTTLWYAEKIDRLRDLASLAQPQVAASPALAPEAGGLPSLDKMMDAFITSEIRGGDKHYALIFKYPTHEALFAAEDQLHAFSAAQRAASPLAPTVAERVPQILTDALIERAAIAMDALDRRPDFLAGVRFAERFHGIGAEKTGGKG